MTKSFSFEIVAHNSDRYNETVALRYRLLRAPLGLHFSQDELAQENNQWHLALCNDDLGVVACLCLVPQTNSHIKMRQVAVDEALQGQGLGAQLVKESEDYARKKGFAIMEMHARDTAVPFYLHLGYEVDRAPFTEVGIPHRYMWKHLT